MHNVVFEGVIDHILNSKMKDQNLSNNQNEQSKRKSEKQMVISK